MEQHAKHGSIVTGERVFGRLVDGLRKEVEALGVAVKALDAGEKIRTHDGEFLLDPLTEIKVHASGAGADAEAIQKALDWYKAGLGDRFLDK